MPGTLEDFAAAVNNVIAMNRDAEQGYRGAADAAKDGPLKQLFEELTLQRGHFAEELQAAVKDLGFEPTHPSGIAGVLHGAWISVKGALSGHSGYAILTEVERGERWSIRTYRESLATNLPPEIRSVLDAQLAKIEEAHNKILQLREAIAPPPPPEPPSREEVMAPKRKDSKPEGVAEAPKTESGGERAKNEERGREERAKDEQRGREQRAQADESQQPVSIVEP
jgi:uncharacterized protein (TIGR02284 family)